MAESQTRILLAGGGYIGLYCARELERILRPGEAQVTLVSPDSFMLFWPLLPEVASGTIEPRHAAVPLRKVLERTRVLTGMLTALDGEEATIMTPQGDELALPYEHVVLGLGSITRVPPIPGVEHRAMEFKSVRDAIDLRNHVLACLEAAEVAPDRGARARALTFVFVGGGYTGVVALGELEDMARNACRYFTTIEPHDMRWMLVEMTERILPEVDEALSDYARELLERRRVEIRLGCEVASAERDVELSSGERVETDTLVWTAGVQPNPRAEELGVAVDEQGRVLVDTSLRVHDRPTAWAAGDVAAVPDNDGGTYPPTAQHAVRQARQLAQNLVSTLRGRPTAPYGYRSRGEFITIGRRKGVAQVGRANLRGALPWLLRRAYYVRAMPSLNRKLRVLGDWAIDLPFDRDVVQLAPMASAQLRNSEQTRPRT
jgi:NADH dehydrogenase